jgi:hypothetical protein
VAPVVVAQEAQEELAAQAVRIASIVALALEVPVVVQTEAAVQVLPARTRPLARPVELPSRLVTRPEQQEAQEALRQSQAPQALTALEPVEVEPLPQAAQAVQARNTTAHTAPVQEVVEVVDTHLAAQLELAAQEASTEGVEVEAVSPV